jgi:hypothetical protein
MGVLYDARYFARNGRATVAINTEKIIPFNSAIQRVIGGNKQKRNAQIFSPGMYFGD